jgi:hypothetical protein
MTNVSQMALSQFLGRTEAQKDISLVIAQDQKELNEFGLFLKNEGFQVAENIRTLISYLSDISKPAKLYVSPNKDNIKSFYDFLVQYPTGQVEIFDSQEMKSKVFQPDYNNSTVVFLVSKKDISEFQSNNFWLLQHVGLTFQD